jgi:hypothetical protein
MCVVEVVDDEAKAFSKKLIWPWLRSQSGPPARAMPYLLAVHGPRVTTRVVTHGMNGTGGREAFLSRIAPQQKKGPRQGCG